MNRDELLAANRKLSPMHGDRLANHLSMAVVALSEMGAPPERLLGFFDAYSRRLTLIETPTSTTSQAPPDHALGSIAQFAPFYGYFRSRMSEERPAALLARWIPRLIPGLAAAGFHGMIRTAYALLSEVDEEVAFSLAFWAATYQPLGGITPSTSQGCAEVVHGLFETGEFSAPPKGIISDQLAEVANHPVFVQTPVVPQDIVLEDVAAFSVDAFAKSDDFTLLHTVTACHAFRLLTPHMVEPHAVVGYLWQAVAAAVLSTANPIPREGDGMSPPDTSWAACLEAAVKSNDPHVIKVVYTAWREFDVYRDPRYIFVASRAVGL